MSSLGEEYPKEQERCRELLEEYQKIGPSGAFGAIAIKHVLAMADKAAISGDITEMIISYKAMQDCS